jgi:hypothetical protein
MLQAWPTPGSPSPACSLIPKSDLRRGSGLPRAGCCCVSRRCRVRSVLQTPTLPSINGSFLACLSVQPPLQDARDALDRIIAKLLDDLNVMGFAFHHPTAPFGRQGGEASSKDLEVGGWLGVGAWVGEWVCG